MKLTGRPTKRTDSVVQRIIGGLSDGTPLTVICREDDMPSTSVVYDWMNSDPELFQQIARAREIGFDRIALEALRIADTPVIGEEITDSEDGRQIKRADMLGHRKLQVETRLKLLAKWDPKRYGDKPDVTINNNVAAISGTVAETPHRTNPEIEAFRKRWAKT